MPAIRILPDNLVNKIAAGEVIERPASVVKELLENALDAGARRITVEVEAGGRRLLRVADDGCGMSHGDAPLGFRGEALPSIASVSRVALETRPAEQSSGTPESGTRIEIHGGRMLAARDVGCPPGTQVEVRSLFYNVPARR